MTRMDRETGRLLTGMEDIRASIHEILLTPIGTVPLFREFGSGLFDLVDAPQNRILAMREKILDALERWEPRINVTRLSIQPEGSTGRVSITVYFKVVETNEETTAEVML